MANYSLEAIRATAAALSSDSRLLIIDRLRQGSATSSELATVAGIGLPAVQKQMAILQQAGLVTSDKVGRVVSHRLQADGLQMLGDWLSTRRSFWTNSFGALDRALQAPDREADSQPPTRTVRNRTSRRRTSGHTTSRHNERKKT